MVSGQPVLNGYAEMCGTDDAEEAPISLGLPQGKTCADCQWFARTCSWLLSLEGTETTCDWAPSRFREKVSGLPGMVAP